MLITHAQQMECLERMMGIWDGPAAKQVAADFAAMKEIAAEIEAPQPVAVPWTPGSGVRGSSTDRPFKSYVIFAVGDLVRSAAFVTWLEERGLRYQQGVGSWKGQQERCFVLEADDVLGNPDFEPWLAGQEAILFLEPAYRNGKLYGSRPAWLSYPTDDKSSDFIGNYGYAGQTQPKGDWTYLPGNGFYQVVSTEAKS